MLNNNEIDYLPQKFSSASSLSTEDTQQEPEPVFAIEGLSLVKPLSQSKFPVYIVNSSRLNKNSVMKVFPWEHNALSHFYVREARFSNFSHSNLISMFHTEDKELFHYNNQPVTGSYILMEYCQYGDFLGAITKYMIPFHDKLLRTYFHQLIECLEYLHSHKAAHLDIKPENMLVGDDYTLKLTDFDLSCMEEDIEVVTKGTKNYRAPEIFNGTCQDPRAADVYSAGIVLFVLKTRGTFPYFEDKRVHNIDMAVLKEDYPELFFENHCKFGERSASFFSEDFKALFLSMTRFDPEKRATISEVKSSNWYQGEIYTNEELLDFMKGRFDSTC